MKRKRIVVLCLMLAALSSSALASSCRPRGAAIVSSNHWILLGGDARGAIKQVIAGEFGKDVNSQKRMLAQFDACGDLLVAESSYDKRERNVILSMEQHTVRVQDGWVAEYSWLVKVLKQGKEVVVDNRQGTIHWQKGRHGNIISAADKFISMGKNGFTDTTYRYDKLFRLQKSVARGSDPLSSGEFHYQWNSQGLVTRTLSDRSNDHYTYDPQWREVRLIGMASTPASQVRMLDECQSWDETGNCTLSFQHETETFTDGTLERHLSAVYKYEYWNKPAEDK